VYDFDGSLIVARGADARLPLSELDELDLASSLLEAISRQRADDMLARTIAVAARRAGVELSPDRASELLSLLGRTARRALAPAAAPSPSPLERPTGPGGLLGLETEGLSPEAAVFEVARQFVRFAAAAAERAARAAPTLPPDAAVRLAARTAARRFAPGLLRPAEATAIGLRPRIPNHPERSV
jgi:hypothetical protein